MRKILIAAVVNALWLLSHDSAYAQVVSPAAHLETSLAQPPQAAHMHPVLRRIRLARGNSYNSQLQPGIFVLDSGWPQIDVDNVAKGLGYVQPTGMKLEFSYNNGSSVGVLSDRKTFKIVAVYEPQCAGCTVEVGTLSESALKLKRAGIETFIVSSADERRVADNFEGLDARLKPFIVKDFQQSIYAAMHVKILPMQYFLDESGTVKLVHLGSFSSPELAILLRMSGHPIR